MRKPETEVRKTQVPATGSPVDCDVTNVEEEAYKIMMHGQMGPMESSAGSMHEKKEAY